jgi:hypothetical protein
VLQDAGVHDDEEIVSFAWKGHLNPSRVSQRGNRARLRSLRSSLALGLPVAGSQSPASPPGGASALPRPTSRHADSPRPGGVASHSRCGSVSPRLACVVVVSASLSPPPPYRFEVIKASRITSTLKTLLRRVASFVGQWRKMVSGRATRFLGRAPAAVGLFWRPFRRSVVPPSLWSGLVAALLFRGRPVCCLALRSASGD